MHKYFELQYIRANLKNWLLMILGTFLTAAGTSLFFAPAKIVCGGISGLSTVLYHVASIPIGISYAVMNAILLLLGIRILGKEFIIKTLIGTGLMSLFMELLSFVPVVTENGVLAALFGGIMYGFGLGFTFIAGASTGGTDILGRILQWRFPAMEIGKILMIIDGVIIALSMVAFRQMDLVLLGILGVFIQTIAIDSLIDRMNVSDISFIVTEKGEEISQMLLHEFERGVTVLDGRGAYTGRGKQVLLCAMKKQEATDFQEKVKELDEEAFVIFSESKTVLGNGFRIYR